MKVFLKKDVEKIGMAGEIVEVSTGYGTNFLVAKGLAVIVDASNEKSLLNKIKQLENRKEVISTKTSMLAERIKDLEITLKRKMHEGKLYGSIGAVEVCELLAEKGFSVSKNQVLLDKSIKSKGIYNITIKLSSKLQPAFKLKVVEEKQA